MRYLITGGAGFIGSHLSDLLTLDPKNHVHIIDDLSTGSIKNITHLKNKSNFSYTIDTIFNERLLAELVDEADIIFHLAASVGVIQIIQNPIQTIENNIEGTKLVLQQASKKKKPTLIASTSEVYGKSSIIPFKEDDDSVLGPTCKARWSYACSKMIDEFIGLSYWKTKNVPVVIVRLFNTVGPRQTGRYGMVLPRFVNQALCGDTITVYGDGNQSRCFGYVGDVVAGLSKIIFNDKAYGQVFNIGSNQEIKIIDLAEMVRAKVNPRVAIQIVSYDQVYEDGFEDMQRRVPSLDKINKLIGYVPTYSTEQIVDEVINYFKEI